MLGRKIDSPDKHGNRTLPRVRFFYAHKKARITPRPAAVIRTNTKPAGVNQRAIFLHKKAELVIYLSRLQRSEIRTDLGRTW